MRKKIIYIIGTRPEIIRSALIISKLKVDSKVLFRLVHTGQHYDYLMDKIFFKELNLPDPDINLEVGSMTHSKQIAEIILKLENFYLQFQPDLVVVFGDTNSSLAGALTAAKLNIPIAHIEAGCREWEMDLPEELNRRLIDHCSNLLLTVSETCVKNLENEEVMGKIYNLGDPLYYVFKKYYDISLNTELSNKLGLEDRKYFLLTLHRSKNVDNIENLVDILSVFDYFKGTKVIFPCHPRTKNQLKKIDYINKRNTDIIIIDPLQYKDILHLISRAKIVITDSGGLQKEAFWAKVPCITIRDHTSWIETVNFGVNFLTGAKKDKIIKKIIFINRNYEHIGELFGSIQNPYVKKNTIERIIELLKRFAGLKW